MKSARRGALVALPTREWLVHQTISIMTRSDPRLSPVVAAMTRGNDERGARR